MELAPPSEAGLVPQAVARALQIPDSPHASTEESLRQYFQGKELLLVIDNCEHLIEPTAALVQGLLRASSGLRVLATSREPLAIPGEVSYLLEPLPILEEAVSLFLERAEAASPGFRSNPEDGPAIREILSGWTACPSPSSWRRPRSASSPPQRSPGDLTSVSAY